MSKAKRREQALARTSAVRSYLFSEVTHPCPNCGTGGPHFVPPSFSDDGFYICTKYDIERGVK